MESQEVFMLDQVLVEAMAVLREAPGPMTTGAVTVALKSYPLWEVDAALERAHQRKLALFTPGPGWSANTGDCLREGGFCRCGAACKKAGAANNPMKGGFSV